MINLTKYIDNSALEIPQLIELFADICNSHHSLGQAFIQLTKDLEAEDLKNQLQSNLQYEIGILNEQITL